MLELRHGNVEPCWHPSHVRGPWPRPGAVSVRTSCPPGCPRPCPRTPRVLRPDRVRGHGPRTNGPGRGSVHEPTVRTAIRPGPLGSGPRPTEFTLTFCNEPPVPLTRSRSPSFTTQRSVHGPAPVHASRSARRSAPHGPLLHAPEHHTTDAPGTTRNGARLASTCRTVAEHPGRAHHARVIGGPAGPSAGRSDCVSARIPSQNAFSPCQLTCPTNGQSDPMSRLRHDQPLPRQLEVDPPLAADQLRRRHCQHVPVRRPSASAVPQRRSPGRPAPWIGPLACAPVATGRGSVQEPTAEGVDAASALPCDRRQSRSGAYARHENSPRRRTRSSNRGVRGVARHTPPARTWALVRSARDGSQRDAVTKPQICGRSLTPKPPA